MQWSLEKRYLSLRSATLRKLTKMYFVEVSSQPPIVLNILFHMFFIYFYIYLYIYIYIYIYIRTKCTKLFIHVQEYVFFWIPLICCFQEDFQFEYLFVNFNLNVSAISIWIYLWISFNLNAPFIACGFCIKAVIIVSPIINHYLSHNSSWLSKS